MSDAVAIERLPDALGILVERARYAQNRILANSALALMRTRDPIVPSLSILRTVEIRLEAFIAKKEKETVLFFFEIEGEARRMMRLVLDVRLVAETSGVARRPVLPGLYSLITPSFVLWPPPDALLRELVGPGALRFNTLVWRTKEGLLAVRADDDERLVYRPHDGPKVVLEPDDAATYDERPFFDALAALAHWAGTERWTGPRVDRSHVMVGAFGITVRTLLSAIVTALRRARVEGLEGAWAELDLAGFEVEAEMRLDADGELTTDVDEGIEVGVWMRAEIEQGGALILTFGPPGTVAATSALEAFEAPLTSRRALDRLAELLSSDDLEEVRAFVTASLARPGAVAIRLERDGKEERWLLVVEGPLAGRWERAIVTFDVERKRDTGELVYDGDLDVLNFNGRVREDFVEHFVEISRGLLDWSKRIGVPG